MNFTDALKQLKANNRELQMVNNRKIIKFFSSPEVLVYKMKDEDPSFYSYRFDIEDILADDWFVCKKEIKLHTFQEAISALKKGKTIKRECWITKTIERDFCDDYSIAFTIDDFDDYSIAFTIDDFEANDWIIVGD